MTTTKRTSVLGRRAERVTTDIASASYELGRILEAASDLPATRASLDALEELLSARILLQRAYEKTQRAAAELDALATVETRVEA